MGVPNIGLPAPKPNEVESGYASGESDGEAFSGALLSPWHLKFLNKHLSRLSAEDVLRWCLVSLPGLYQETAFGLSGLVILDMLSKLNLPRKNSAPLLFLDTLHHFDETLDLVDQVHMRYPQIPMHVYRPTGAADPEEFAAKYGERLWEKDEELYDYVAKVEPARRAYSELNIKAFLTGRRKAQGEKRKTLDVIEVDETGLIKVNPLANWSFEQVKGYIDTHQVPYNKLLDQGYKSVGDWHSTSPVNESENERAGRWKGREKTECGIHNPASRYFQMMMQAEKPRPQQPDDLPENPKEVSTAA